MIATALILDRACTLFTSPSPPTCGEVLDTAFSQFISSNTHNAVNQLLLPELSPKPVFTQQCTEFILLHRLR